MLTKTGRKRSADPIQEALRQSKDTWNDEVSRLIRELIALKRGMNGWGDPDAGLPPSSIKFPLPDEIIHFLGETSLHGSKIFEFGKRVIQQQHDYAASRTKMASWWGSRFSSRLNLWRKLQQAEYDLRKKLLSSCAEAEKKTKRIEAMILDWRNPISIPITFTQTNELTLNFVFDIIPNFLLLQNLMQAKKEEDRKEGESLKHTEVAKPETKDFSLEAAKKDQVLLGPILISLKSKIDDKEFKALEEQYEIFSKALNTLILLESKSEAEKNAFEEKKLILAITNALLQIKELLVVHLGPGTLQDYVVKIGPEDKKAGQEWNFFLFKEAQFSLGKFINKKILQIAPNSLNKIKLDFVHISSEFRESLQKLMDALEKHDSSLDDLVKYMFTTINTLYTLSERITDLGKLHNEKIRRSSDEKLHKERVVRDIKQEDFRKAQECRIRLTPYIFELLRLS